MIMKGNSSVGLKRWCIDLGARRILMRRQGVALNTGLAGPAKGGGICVIGGEEDAAALSEVGREELERKEREKGTFGK